MKLCFISDTHTLHSNLEKDSFHDDIDVLVHCGDITSKGDFFDVQLFSSWFREVKAKHRICIAGNHDFCFQKNYKKDSTKKYTEGHEALTKKRWVDSLEIHGQCKYLEDEEIIIEGVKFYGSPWQPEFSSWAFNLPRNGFQLRAVWRKIPDDTDILITHGPPKGILDLTKRDNCYAGCERLKERVLELNLAIHSFGHIHEQYGTLECAATGTTFINASVCTLEYKPTNKPIYVNYNPQNRDVKLI